eukprot:NODE_4441_length_807_cov_17.306069_g4107_i0.p1 GENE.NODE_4441_length_807_cov_17.306069_g4107_i0~~NODE_4441_length_807_cov_17.306069_g4107_i0.p1  ORF type:complete len:236 (+),score=76.75 NODE_4441_length_807_cov_17.306069_g4107_i0:93-710(+)
MDRMMRQYGPSRQRIEEPNSYPENVMMTRLRDEVKQIESLKRYGIKYEFMPFHLIQAKKIVNSASFLRKTEEEIPDTIKVLSLLKPRERKRVEAVLAREQELKEQKAQEEAKKKEEKRLQKKSEAEKEEEKEEQVTEGTAVEAENAKRVSEGGEEPPKKRAKTAAAAEAPVPDEDGKANGESPDATTKVKKAKKAKKAKKGESTD